MLESEYEKTVDEKQIHLMLNGSVLKDGKKTLSALGVKEGSVFEMCISDHEAIHTLLDKKESGLSVEWDSSEVLDEVSLLSSRIVFGEVSGGYEKTSVWNVKRYLESVFEAKEVSMVMKSLCGGEVDERQFVVMLRVLQRGVKEGVRLRRSEFELLSKPLERVQRIRECGKEGFVCDPSWVASYESVKMCIEKMREEGDLWRLPGHVIADVNEEMCEEKREWSERM